MFFIIIIMVVISAATSMLLDLFYNFVVLKRILARSMSEAYFYIDTHGKGYYRAPNEQALDREQHVRLVASMAYHAALLCFAFVLAIIAPIFGAFAKAAGIAIVAGVIFTAFIALKIESASGCEIYKLVSSDKENWRLRFHCLASNQDYEIAPELWPKDDTFEHCDFYIIYRFFGLCYFTALSDRLEVILLGTDTEEQKKD